MAQPSPVEQVAAQNAVRATTTLLSEVTQGIVDTRRVAALLASMNADRVLDDVLGSVSDRIGEPIVAAAGEG